MGLFSKRRQNRELLSPLTGTVIPVAQCPDATFAGKVLGDGIAVIPTDGRVYAPADGQIVQIAHSLHAVCMVTDDGLELLVHLGMDTVKLSGRGFTCHIEVGAQVCAGDLIMEMDLAFVEAQGLSTISPCIITNLDAVKGMEARPGAAQGGETPALAYRLAQTAVPSPF